MIKVTVMTPMIENMLLDSHQHFVYQSILEGHTLGDIYVDSIEDTNFYIVYDGGNEVIYTGGSACEDDYRRYLRFLKKEVFADKRKVDNVEYLLVAYPDDVFLKVSKELFTDQIVHESTKSLFEHHAKDYIYTEALAKDYQLEAITEELLERELVNSEGLREEIVSMWGSLDQFVKHGFGRCAVRDNTLLAWCTAEFMSNKSCGIGIETYENEEGKGIATQLGRSFLVACSERGLRAHWDSWTKNFASVRVAEKLGFKRLEDYNVYVIKL